MEPQHNIGGIPVAAFNANLRKLGRSLEGATIKTHRWEAGEYGLDMEWPDGFSAFVGLGAIASAILAADAQNEAPRVH